jgi:anti-sigma regulatory factor (Ser/Thr protein kinase)
MQTILSIQLPARVENLKTLIQSVSSCAKSQGFGHKRNAEIELAAEEALVNVCNYSYPEKPGDVEINCKIDGSRFIIEVIDSGIPFDVTSISSPNLTADIDERRVGGLGVFLMKKITDEVVYRRENDRNILSLIIKIEKG